MVKPLIAKILLPLPKLFLLDYAMPNGMELKKGHLVQVPFRSKMMLGIVFEVSDTPESINYKLKSVISKLEYRIPEHMLELLKKASNYYLSDLDLFAN